MADYQLELRQVVDYPRCRIYREFMQTLIADRSIRTGGCSGLFYYVVLCAYANFRTSYRRIDGISYTVYPGEWICSITDITEWFRVRFHYNEIDLELPGKQPCAYYCITSDQDSTFDFLSSLFLSFVFIRLVRYADEHCPGGELPVPVHVLGEELCACGVIPDLSRKISVIRSRNLSMSCVFQNLAGLQNRYPYNQWQEILGNCDVQLFLGCTDALTAEFISDRTGEASISVTSKAKQLGTWRVSNYTPEYRETSGVGRRKLMTMDEVLRMDIDKALILIRGKNVLEVDKYDYSKHPEAKKLRPSKAASHVPAWRANQPQEKQTPSAPPSQAADKKPAQKKKPASAEKVVAVTKESIMKNKEDT